MEEMENDLAEVREQLPSKRQQRLAPWYRYVAAAAVAAVMAVGVYVYFFQSERLDTETGLAATSLQDDLAPGGNRAILQLAAGTDIILEESTDGRIAQEEQNDNNKQANGE